MTPLSPQNQHQHDLRNAVASLQAALLLVERALARGEMALALDFVREARLASTTLTALLRREPEP